MWDNFEVSDLYLNRASYTMGSLHVSHSSFDAHINIAQVILLPATYLARANIGLCG